MTATQSWREAAGRLLNFDHAGASPLSPDTLKTLTDYYDAEARLGGYEAARQYEDALDKFYTQAAALIGAQRHEIAYAQNGTAAWAHAMTAIEWTPGDHIIVAGSLYVAGYMQLRLLAERFDLKIDILSAEETGAIDLNQLEAAITSRTRLIACDYVPMHFGGIAPVVEIGALAEKAGVLFALDACQAIGQLPVDVKEIGCHILTATGRKFLRAPRGTGFLYVSDRIADTLKPQHACTQSAALGHDGAIEWMPGAQRFEIWERNYAGQLALTGAISDALSASMGTITRNISARAQYLFDRLPRIDGLSLFEAAPACASLTFCIKGMVTEGLHNTLRTRSILTSLIRTDQIPLVANAPSRIRAAVHHDTSYEDIDAFASLLAEIVSDAVSV